ncbi:hypothetical protein GGS20DRAFT_533540 [Poronia punctata]|nr:hypothetical protein GGS20DRAFT_533540 [Poronia punctata]
MPDIDSAPTNPSGTEATSSRRASISQSVRPQQQQTLSSLSSALSDLNILPSNQQEVQEGSAAHVSSPPTHSPGVGPIPIPGTDTSGPGPLRHPRPLTTAELHSQMEQEQELLVNRLSRDLMMVRSAQNSSVISNTSSASASNSAIDELRPSSLIDTHMMSGPGYSAPTSIPHNRRSSNASVRSFNQGNSSFSNSLRSGHQAGDESNLSDAGHHLRDGSSMHRQNSSTSGRSNSRNRSPHPHPHPHPHPGRSNMPGLISTHSYGTSSSQVSYDPGASNVSIMATTGSETSLAQVPATPRYEELGRYRAELESARTENNMLRKRVQDLEKLIKEHREGDASPGRARSGSTGKSSNLSLSGTTGVGGVVGRGTGIAGDRRDERREVQLSTRTASMTGSIGVGVSDVELKVGESAASGIDNGHSHDTSTEAQSKGEN